MANATGILLTNDHGGQKADKFFFSNGTAGTLNGATEFGFVVPEGTWKVTNVVLSAGTNTTHTSADQIDVTVEKNTDGGTSVLTTTPKLTAEAGTGQRDTAAAGTGITVAVVDTAENEVSEGDILFATLTEAGSGGTDPSDVFFVIELQRVTDLDPAV